MKESIADISKQPLRINLETLLPPPDLTRINEHLDSMNQQILRLRSVSSNTYASLSAMVPTPLLRIVETTHHVSNYNPTAYTTTPDSQNMLVDDDNPTTIILDTEGTYRGIYSHGFFQETSARSTSVENRSTALGMHID